MLQAMAPFALKTYKEERHDFEVKIVDTIAGLVGEEEKKHLALVEAAEASLAEHTAEKQTVSAELEEAVTITGEKKDSREERQREIQAAEAAVKASKDLLEAARVRQHALIAVKQGRLDEKAQYEQILLEVYEKLKDNSFAAQNWRERNKGVDKILLFLERASASQSLIASLAVALKTKLSARGKFAQQAVEHGEAMLPERAVALAQDAAGLDEEIADKANEVIAAEERAALESSQYNAASEAWIAAENEWAESNQKEFDLRGLKANFPPETKQRSKAVEKAKAGLVSFQELAGVFAGLRERSAEVLDAIGADAAVEMEVMSEAAQADSMAPAEVPAETADVAA